MAFDIACRQIEERRGKLCGSEPMGEGAGANDHEWLFPSPRPRRPQLFGWFQARNRVHERMEKLAGVTIPSWHFHDFRRTFRSNARRIGIDRDIAELMLNHKRKGIEGSMIRILNWS
jgi:integrase